MSSNALVECDCGARLAPQVLVTNGNACPECEMLWQRCPNPTCLEWIAQLPHAADGCPWCGMPADAIADLRTGARTLPELREDPRVPIPRLDDQGSDAPEVSA
jgi:hypothetical protein